MRDRLRSMLILGRDGVITVKRVIEHQDRGERACHIEDPHSQDKDDPVCFIVRTETHHEETADDEDRGDGEKSEAHLGFERPAGFFRLA